MPTRPNLRGPRRATTAKRRLRPKLDPRLALILSLSRQSLKALKDQEDGALLQIGNEIRSALRGLAQDGEAGPDPKRLEKLRGLSRKLFSPITAGVYLASPTKRRKRWPATLREPYVSGFILSEASARDLSRLGVKIRSQAGDIFTAFIPFSAIGRLEASPAIRYIELARPHFETLDEAVPLAQIDVLHTAIPSITGAGVVVGIFDSVLDIYHPDFRTAGGATRVSFLWDQTLVPRTGEAGPPTLPGFAPASGAVYGVEYTQADIDAELTAFNSAAPNAYTRVRHGGAVAAHGTHVAGIAVGNGLGQGGTFTGAAPGANLIFVAHPNLFNINLLSDSAFLADGFSYVFARAAALGLPCVVNMSNSDNQGPHDGSTLGERFLDDLLLTPGRAITVSAGNSNDTACHAAGTVAEGTTVNVVLAYAAGAANSDAIEIWYDGHDRFSVTLTVPTAPATVIGPVSPGSGDEAVLPSGVEVRVESVLNDASNNDNQIRIVIIVPAGQTVPIGNWTFALTGITVINGRFQAWVDRNNRSPAGVALATWQAPFLGEDTLTLGVPATGRRVITVGNHDKTTPAPNIFKSSGRGPTRDGRTKPEIATVGRSVTAPRSRDMNAPSPGGLYVPMSGTSMSAPLATGACALLFECRGASATWADMKQILEESAGLAVPSTAFGFGFMQMATACTAPPVNVDVWLRDDPADTGLEPFTGPVAWLSPDIEVLDFAGNPVPNPSYDPVKRFNNIIRITVRNRGTQTARNTEVYFYWADPATNIPYPAAWNTSGIYAGAPGFQIKPTWRSSLSLLRALLRRSISRGPHLRLAGI